MTNRPFTLEGKALAPVVQTERGDLILSGLAAVWDGLDADGENFIREAFSESTIRSYLDGQAPLVFHHKPDMGIGRVVELRPNEHGLEFKAVVQRQERTSPLFYVYDAIRRGIYRGVSLGGYFRRKVTDAGRRISDVRISELSITPAAKHGGTFATAVEVKALMGDDDGYLKAARTWLGSRGVDTRYLRDSRVADIDRRIAQLRRTLLHAEIVL